jgi:hypothetical protein
MEYASSKLELDCWTARYIFCRQAEVGFSLELDLTRSLGHSQNSISALCLIKKIVLVQKEITTNKPKILAQEKGLSISLILIFFILLILILSRNSVLQYLK